MQTSPSSLHWTCPCTFTCFPYPDLFPSLPLPNPPDLLLKPSLLLPSASPSAVTSFPNPISPAKPCQPNVNQISTLRLIPVQASQAAAASGTQAFTSRLQQAKASIAQLDAELQSNQRLLHRQLRECEGWASRHQHTVQALRDQLPQELMLPDSHWMFAQAPVLVGGLHPLQVGRSCFSATGELACTSIFCILV